MRMPDGYISILHPDGKGTEVRVEQRELVLCKHCKHYREDEDEITYCELNFTADWKDDDFCSYGERRKDGNDD